MEVGLITYGDKQKPIKTKEEILDVIRKKNYFDARGEEMPEHFHINKDSALEAMEEYAKQEASLFSEFRHEYQRIEAMNVRHYNMEKYGTPVAVTWIGAPDDVIWEAYRKGEQLKRYYEK